MPSVDNRVVNLTFNNSAFNRSIESTMRGLADLEKALRMEGAVKGMGDVTAAADKLKNNVATISEAFNLNAAKKELADVADGLDKAGQHAGTLGKNAADVNGAFRMDGAKKGLADLSDAAGRVGSVGLAGLSHGVEGVSSKFVAMSTIAISALATITTQAVHSGEAMIKALTIDPVLDGYREYETQLNAVQTILANTASKGTTLDDVNRALAELNNYADQTIYNFGQMAKNIGTFTAAGVDLNTSVQSIKGIANLAALSGSSAEQASTAMYQLSQALAAGKIRLIDWISVRNAGMGGEVFQRTLFETGKALKTIKGIDVGTTFEQWSKSVGGFQESLASDWLTTDVMTTALGAFTGDMKDADLAAKGFNQTQIDQIQLNAKNARLAATQVKTFTQLIGTVKEAIGTGFADTFKIIFGNFTEARDMWSRVYTSISKVITRVNDVRNLTLTGWKQGGGALYLYDGIKRAVIGLWVTLLQVKDAFREIFPRKSAQDLIDLTHRFDDFTQKLIPAKKTLDNIKLGFKGFFAAVSIGWEVIKGVVKTIATVVGALAGLGGQLSGGPLKSLADWLIKLQMKGVDKEGIKKFFDDLTDKIVKMIPTFKDIKDGVEKFFDLFKSPIVKTIEDVLERINGKAGTLKKTIHDAQVDAGGFLDPLWQAVERAGKKLDKAFDSIKEWFHTLGQKVADELNKVDWSAVTAALDTALLGIVTGVIVKFFKGAKNGKLDLTIDPTGGLFKGVKDSFDQLTSVLVDMQTRVKADALEKIAIAVGVLTAAVIALTFIDPAKLTAALTAMGFAFGEMISAFYVLNNLNSSPFSAAQFAVIAAGFNVLAASMVIFAGAVAAFGTMDLDTLAKGMLAVTIVLGEMLAVSHLLGDSAPQMILAGAGMTALGVGLNIIALAVRQLGTMDMGQMLQGLGGITAALIGIGTAMGLMPLDMPIMAVGLIALSVALNAIALAVRQLGTMDMDQMMQGLGGIAFALIGIGTAMGLMPLDMPIMAAGLIAVGVALNIIALAVRQFGDIDMDKMLQGLGGVAFALIAIGTAMGLMPLDLPLTAAGLVGVAIALQGIVKVVSDLGGMSIGELAKGIVAMGLALVVLAVGMAAMGEAGLQGGLALTVAGLGLKLFVSVLKEIIGIKMGDLAAGIGKLALALGAIAAVSLLLAPAVPAILGLGIALAVLGGAFFLFGAGIALVAKGFSELAKTGAEGSKNLVKAMENVGKALPAFLDGLAKATLSAIGTLGKGLVMFAGLVTEFIGKLLDGVITLMPKMYTIMYKLLKGLIQLIYTFGGPMIQVGLFLLVQLLEGIRDNIEHITEVVGDIIIQFLTAMKMKMPGIITAGTDLLVTFLDGIAAAIPQIGASIDRIIVGILEALGLHAVEMITAGLNLLLQILFGIASNISKAFDAAGAIIGEIIRAFGAETGTIIQAGVDVLVNFLKGIADNLGRVIDAAVDIIVAIIKGVDRSLQRIIDAGGDLIVHFIQGIDNKLGDIITAGTTMIIHLIHGIASNALIITNAAADTIVTFVNGLATAIDTHAEELRHAGERLAGAIINGLTGGLAGKAGDVAQGAIDVASNAVKSAKGFLKVVGDPYSLVMLGVGDSMTNGMRMGLDAGSVDVVQAAENVVANALGAFSDMGQLTEMLGDMDEFNPVITPVLDLSKVEADASKITDYIQRVNPLVPSNSFNQAQAISAGTTRTSTTAAPASEPREVKFEQHNYSPEPLDTAAIYKQTRNQIAFAKEELSIP